MEKLRHGHVTLWLYRPITLISENRELIGLFPGVLQQPLVDLLHGPDPLQQVV